MNIYLLRIKQRNLAPSILELTLERLEIVHERYLQRHLVWEYGYFDERKVDKTFVTGFSSQLMRNFYGVGDDVECRIVVDTLRKEKKGN